MKVCFICTQTKIRSKISPHCTTNGKKLSQLSENRHKNRQNNIIKFISIKKEIIRTRAVSNK